MARSHCIHCSATLRLGSHKPDCPEYTGPRDGDGVVSTDEHVCGCGHDIHLHKRYENVLFCHGNSKETGVCGCRRWNPNDSFTWLPASFAVLARGSPAQRIDLVRGVSAILRYLGDSLPPHVQELVDELETYDGSVVAKEKATPTVDHRESILAWLKEHRDWLASELAAGGKCVEERQEVVYVIQQIAACVDMQPSESRLMGAAAREHYESIKEGGNRG